ncbi:MAG: TIGR03643 family protein [Nonlabens sp.]
MAKAKELLEDLDQRSIDRIIEMAWEDRTPFGAIEFQFGVTEAEVIKIMRDQMKASSFRMWRERVQGRSTKHRAQRDPEMDRFKCSRQKQITHNKISKR